MGITLLANGMELDIKASTAQASIAAREPFKNGETQLTYTTSITAPSNHNNDAVLGCYRHSDVLYKTPIVYELFLDGIKLGGTFSGRVEYSGDAYKIQLFDAATDYMSKDDEFQRDNSVAGRYNQNISNAAYTDVRQLLSGYYGEKLNGCVSFEDIGRQVVIKNVVTRKLLTEIFTASTFYATQNRTSGVDGRFTFAYSTDIDALLSYPDEQRTATMIASTVDNTIGVMAPAGATVVLNFNRTKSVQLSYVGAAPWRGTLWRVPASTVVAISPYEPLDLQIVGADGKPYGLSTTAYPKFSLSVSGSTSAVTSIDFGFTSPYELLMAYLSLTYQAAFKRSRPKTDSMPDVFYSFKRILGDETRDWSSRIVSIDKVGDASGIGAKIVQTVGDYDWAVDMKFGQARETTTAFNSSMPNSKDTAEIAPRVGVLQSGAFYPIYTSGACVSDLAGYTYNFAFCLEIDATVQLSIFDLLDFDGSARYYFEQLNAYCYIVSIESFDLQTKKAKIKLLKLV